ncbi:MAG: preprotein translocase subunit SecA [Dehalococcoidia bacterium]|nr:MAG: preprotein translocase subunit SecA [Dehalococcoidia bacterium]
MFKRLTSIIGDSNEKELKRLTPLVDEINSLEPDIKKLSDEELAAKSTAFKDRLDDGEDLDDLLPEVFTAVREAAWRKIKQRHFDVQLMGGIVLHQGKIAEMKTGEGKTLVATLPVTLNALIGEGVHVVTVNDYLAKRDTQWMGAIYHFLGFSVACIQAPKARCSECGYISEGDMPPKKCPDCNATETAFQRVDSFLFDPSFDSKNAAWRFLRPIPKKEAYQVDITYGTNNQFGFDYLRDNMVVDLSHRVQRELNYAIVDEVDNILIDEARTPLIISGAAAEAAQKYITFAKLVPRLRVGEDYAIEERTRAVTLTEVGVARMEQWLGLPNLYDPANYTLTHYLDNALKAQVLYKRDRDYVVKDGEVVIVDEFTGRLMFGRRFSEGLHQAIEAKEGVKIQRESVTMATITFQNYFRMYEKLAGMTGTAVTEAEEFDKIYGLDVVVIPTNKPMIRDEYRDQIYKNEEGKYRAVVREIEELHGQGRPILVGTVSIERSEYLSDLLKKKGISHQVLNAKQHEQEAGVVAQAGRLGGVTIATNMAGRGVDIILGGRPDDGENSDWEAEHDKVVELGGLHVIGTERHEARRIDNQLRGRAGRQGDPGSSRFYVSLEDDLMRRFGGDRVKGVMEFVGFDEDTPLEHGLVGKVIENSQQKVEAYHFDIRKHLVDYDDVVNKHREVIYAERDKLLSGADLKANIQDMIREAISGVVNDHLHDEHGDNWDMEGLITQVNAIFPLPAHLNKNTLSQMSRREVEDKLLDYADTYYEERERELEPQKMRVVERLVMLRSIDSRWVEHLTSMENMRQGIGLQALAQRDPLVAYKRQGHEMFRQLMAGIQHDIVHTIYRVGIVKEERPRELEREKVPVAGRTGRNDPCPCGSGKKFKKCCGK